MRIDGQRSTGCRNAKWPGEKWPDCRCVECEEQRFRNRVGRLYRALPALTDRTPDEHARAAARMVADMKGGGL